VPLDCCMRRIHNAAGRLLIVSHSARVQTPHYKYYTFAVPGLKIKLRACCVRAFMFSHLSLL
jgi:hypothetical protein